MYDPARDSWKDERSLKDSVTLKRTVPAKKPESNELQETSTAVDDARGESTKRAREDSKSANTEEIKEIVEQGEQQLKEDASTCTIDEGLVKPEDYRRGRVETTNEHSNPKADASSEVKVEARETSRSPPRKLKKPTVRKSQAERDKIAQEMRENLDKRESQSVDESVAAKSSDPVRDHYNERPETDVKLRTMSPIIKLRSFNNFIKSALIQAYGFPKSVVLDIGCGKGGDLLKWSKNSTKGYIGIDIADVSISQAKERYENIKRKTFWADFCVGDAYGDTVQNIVHPDAFPVDIVSIQFSMHYAYENEERARMMISNVSRALKRGGRFLGTIPNSDMIKSRIDNLGPGQSGWGNSIYSVRFEDTPPKEFRQPYGLKYLFYLQDAVTNVPEYIVPFEAFRALAQEHDLELIYKKPFLEMFDSETKRNPDFLYRLCEKMGVVKSDGSFGIEGEEREACEFYLAFAFEKVR